MLGQIPECCIKYNNGNFRSWKIAALLKMIGCGRDVVNVSLNVELMAHSQTAVAVALKILDEICQIKLQHVKIHAQNTFEFRT